MSKISEEVLVKIRENIIGKDVRYEDETGKTRGICTFFGYNPYFPSWELQITINRTAITNIKLSNITILE